MFILQDIIQYLLGKPFSSHFLPKLIQELMSVSSFLSIIAAICWFITPRSTVFLLAAYLYLWMGGCSTSIYTLLPDKTILNLRSRLR